MLRSERQELAQQLRRSSIGHGGAPFREQVAQLRQGPLHLHSTQRPRGARFAAPAGAPHEAATKHIDRTKDRCRSAASGNLLEFFSSLLTPNVGIRDQLLLERQKDIMFVTTTARIRCSTIERIICGVNKGRQHYGVSCNRRELLPWPELKEQG
jgi:hypothetical protein